MPFSQLPVRERLTANRTYYVRTDGSDANSGLANTAAGAFLTLQKALDVITYSLDLNGFTAAIQVGAGTYTAGINQTRPFVGAGSVTVTGDIATPSNCLISTTGTCINVSAGARLTIGGFKLVSSAGDGLVANERCKIFVTNPMEFGACAGAAHVRALGSGTIDITANYTISGNSPRHYYAAGTGSSITCASNTVTLTGTPAFSTAFAVASSLASLTTFGQTYSGSATGARFSAETNAAISTAGGGANYFPGDSAGAGTNSGASPYGLYS